MASSNEGNERDRTGVPQEESITAQDTDNRAAHIEANEPEYEHYSAEDPFRSERIAALDSEVRDVLPGLSNEEVRSIDKAQAERIQKDADERKRWTPAMAAQFRGALSLAKLRTPSRYNRIL